MALWWKALAWVPWSDVVRNAPQVVNGARKLWQSTGRSSARSGYVGGRSEVAGAHQNDLDALRTQVAELQEEMRQATLLITRLAEQQSEFVMELSRLRLRQSWVAAAAAIACAVAAWALWVAAH